MEKLLEAKEVLQFIDKTDSNSHVDVAIRLAALILEKANQIETKKEAKLQTEISRMMNDPIGKPFTTAITDQGFRSNDNGRIADQIRYLLKTFGIPTFLSPFQQFALKGFKYLGSFFPFIFVPVTKFLIRKQTNTLILPGERESLIQAIQKKSKEGVRVNLNHLGEAILGEEEALRRLNTYLLDLEDPHIEYISVKVSTLFSQINLLDWNETLKILSSRYEQLLKKADQNTYLSPKGEKRKKFVNLDMEEYRDLELTVELFKTVLDKPEFKKMSAGIVLQAYLPDSFLIQKELTEWAEKRFVEGGSPIKIRIVKGANLAMEQVEASLKGWQQAPYLTKSEVDANFKRMLNYGLNHTQGVKLGIGSHNLFDISYALIQTHHKKVVNDVTFEMLEGMADSIRKVVQELCEDMLLYCPCAKKDEFQNAVAYLVRRLDENTAPDNYLRHSFNLKPYSPAFENEAERFRKAVYEQDKTSVGSRRRQINEVSTLCRFRNEPDTDLSLKENRNYAAAIFEKWSNKKNIEIPLVIGGEVLQGTIAKGVDPSRPSYQFDYHLAGPDLIEKALVCASQDYPEDDLSRVAPMLKQRRDDLIGAMVLNVGKTFHEADSEVSEAIDFVNFYQRSKEQLKFLEDVQFKPKGATLIAPPWNFPVSIPMGGIIAALLMGNNVIFKPPKESVLPAWILAETLWQAGISKKRLQFVMCNDEPEGSLLVQDPRVKLVVLTGSSATARLFHRIQNGIKLIGETGGKNAIIVSNLSDHDLAIKDILHSAFSFSGQKCSAASLLILHEELYDNPDFKRQFLDAAKSYKVGSAWDLGTKVNPLINEPSPHLLKALTELEEGEEWLLEPAVDPQNTRLWSPGIKWGVKKGSFTHQTEFFGPVLGVIKYSRLEEAIDVVNSTPYGLTSGLFSLDPREMNIWKEKIIAGNLYINRTVTGAIVERQPFGGTKESFYGCGFKAGGPNYLFAYANKENKSSSNKITYDAFFKGYFSKKHDPAQILGQDNLLSYVPHKKVYAFGDKEDLKWVIEACKVTHTPLETFQGDEEDFIKHLPDRAIVRLTKPPSDYLSKELNLRACMVYQGPPLANGRVELLNYLREVALSYDYHRYGNLGVREKQREGFYKGGAKRCP